MDSKRFDIFFDKHIGIGIRWDSFKYALEISIALIMFTVVIGIGEEKEPNGQQ